MAKLGQGKTIAVIGQGNMGCALAESLLAKGQSVAVWNRTAAKCGVAIEAGAELAPALAELSADVTVLCVSDHQATLSFREELAGPLRGKLLVQLSTVTSDESRELGRWAEAQGIDYLDGTIFSYPAGVRADKGTIIYSGPRPLFDANRGLFEGMGGDPRFLSDKIGAAQTFDKALYSFHYGTSICFLHGAAMSHAAGIPIAAYVEQVLEMATSTVTKERMAKMVEARTYGSDTCAIEVEMAAYDHVPKLSETLGIESELPRLIAKIMERACQAGYAKKDLAAVFEVLLDPEK